MSAYPKQRIRELLLTSPDFTEKRRFLILHYLYYVPTGTQMVEEFPGIHPDDFLAVRDAFDADDVEEIARIITDRKKNDPDAGYGPVYALHLAYDPDVNVLALQPFIGIGAEESDVREPKLMTIPAGFDPSILH